MIRALCALLVLALLPASAAAKAPYIVQYYGGETKLKYYDNSGYPLDVTEAARQWSEAGTPIRLTRTRSLRNADIRVRSQKGKLNPSEPAGLGGPGSVLLSRDALETSSPAIRVAVIAHEFGHALGLGHSRGCTVMSKGTIFTRPDLCKQPEPPTYVCGPQTGDVTRLARIWRFKPEPASHTCEFKGYPAELVNSPSSFTEFETDVKIRNTGTIVWGEFMTLVNVDANGNMQRCPNQQQPGEPPFLAMMSPHRVNPGQVATFHMPQCEPSPNPSRYRLADQNVGFPGIAFGPIHIAQPAPVSSDGGGF